MAHDYRVFLLKLNPGADINGLYEYFALHLKITDSMRQKDLVFNTPGLVAEADSMEEAQKIRDDLTQYGARVEIKSPLLVLEKLAAEKDRKKEDEAAAPSKTSSSSLVSLILQICLVIAIVFGSITYFRKTGALNLKTPASAKPASNVTNKPTNETADAPKVSAFPGDVQIVNVKIDESGPLAGISAEIKGNNYSKAWTMLGDYLYENPHDKEAIKTYKLLALNLGKQSYSANKPDDSIKYLELALKYAPEDPDLNSQLGALYYGKNDFQEARDYLENALRYGSNDVDVHVLLAKLFYFHGDNIPLAVSHLEKALEIQPNRKDIKSFLEKIRKEHNLEQNFKSAQSDHFIVKYEGIEDQNAAYTVLYILEQAWSGIGYDLGEYPTDPVVTVLYTGKQFSETTEAPQWANGIFDGRIRLPVAGLPDRNDDALKRVLYHEYTHVAIYRITKGNCPVWINEGVAQYMQARGSSGQDPWLKPSVISGANGAISLKALSGAFINLSAQDALKAYATSYFAVTYMIQEYGLTGVSRLLKKLGDGLSLDDAMKDALGASLDDFERRFLLYLMDKGD